MNHPAVAGPDVKLTRLGDCRLHAQEYMAAATPRSTFRDLSAAVDVPLGGMDHCRPRVPPAGGCRSTARRGSKPAGRCATLPGMSTISRRPGSFGDDQLTGGVGTDIADGGQGVDLCSAETVTNCEG